MVESPVREPLAHLYAARVRGAEMDPQPRHLQLTLISTAVAGDSLQGGHRMKLHAALRVAPRSELRCLDLQRGTRRRLRPVRALCLILEN